MLKEMMKFAMQLSNHSVQEIIKTQNVLQNFMRVYKQIRLNYEKLKTDKRGNRFK